MACKGSAVRSRLAPPNRFQVLQILPDGSIFTQAKSVEYHGSSNSSLTLDSMMPLVDLVTTRRWLWRR